MKPETLPLFEQFLGGGELLRPAVSYSGYYVRFGVSQVHVGRIVRRDNWGHI